MVSWRGREERRRKRKREERESVCVSFQRGKGGKSQPPADLFLHRENGQAVQLTTCCDTSEVPDQQAITLSSTFMSGLRW